MIISLPLRNQLNKYKLLEILISATLPSTTTINDNGVHFHFSSLYFIMGILIKVIILYLLHSTSGNL